MTSKTVLEVGAGIGDHTHFFLDRECRVTATDGRPGNAQILAARYPKINVRLLDLNTPDSSIEGRFDIVYCYGLLYHLDQPAAAIEYMSSRCKDMLLLETCVSYGNESLVNLCDEDASAASQSITGVGCRPTRRWLHEELGKQFAHVYMPNTQPFHAEFPIDWTAADESTTKLIRSVFVASRRPLDNPLLFEGIPMQQSR